MRKFVLILLFVLIGTSFLSAQESGKGIGIILGEPTGVSGKLWLNNVNAIDMAAAWSFNKGALRLQADYVTHFYKILDVPQGKLPLYVGIGGHITFANEFGMAVRIPIGLDYMFPTVPLDVFVEAVPGLTLAPETKFYIAGGLGLRFFFK